MCRFLTYKGPPVLLADLLSRPEHSLIRQSYSATAQETPLNGDGAGIGWYLTDSTDNTPCVFTSVAPAWANRNLKRLAEKITSPCIFAHVRAASEGLAVTELNCHPFQYDDLLWMHNGRIAQFYKVKRNLQNQLPDHIYNRIEGTTDSEHAFALYLSILEQQAGNSRNKSDLLSAMIELIRQLDNLTTTAEVTEVSRYNFALTDGKTLIVTHYADMEQREPPSLFYTQGVEFKCHDGICEMQQAELRNQTVIVASEPLTTSGAKWNAVARNAILVIDSDSRIESVPIN